MRAPTRSLCGWVAGLTLTALVGEPAADALDPAKAPSQYSQTTLDSDHGLPTNALFDVLQARDGYLWMATQEGLVRYDGVRTKIFDSENTPGIPSDAMWQLWEAPDRALWIGTDGGLVRMKDGSFQNFAEGLPDPSIRAVRGDRSGAIWVGSKKGLARFVDGAFKLFTTSDGLPNDYVTSILEDSDRVLWVGTLKGLARRRGERFERFTDALGPGESGVDSIAQDREGRLWFGTRDGVIIRMEGGHISRFGKAEGVPAQPIRSILEDRDGAIWAGTLGGGLVRMYGGHLVVFDHVHGLESDQVWPLTEDREGNLWVGTNTSGLVRLGNPKFLTYTMREGLSCDPTRSVLVDRDDTIWVTNEESGVDRIKDGRVTTLTEKDGLSGNVTEALAQSRDGAIWVGTQGSGVNRIKDGRITKYTAKDGLSSDNISAILEDQRGRMWFGTFDGELNVLEGGKFTIYHLENHPFVADLMESPDGGMWLATSVGLMEFKDGQFINHPPTGKGRTRASSMTRDASGGLWITHLDGVTRVKNSRRFDFGPESGFYMKQLLGMATDDEGRLWISTDEGIIETRLADLDAHADGKGNRVPYTLYGIADGLKSKECNGGIKPSVAKTHDGKIVFPSVKGVVVVDPHNIPSNPLPPPVYVEETLVDGQTLRGALDLPPGRKSIAFSYTALSLTAPEKVLFKYKLEGFDKDWVDAQTRRTAYYTNLAPGSYVFRVIAANNDGVWNATGATVTMRLRPFFFQTAPFYVLCVLGVAALVGSGVWLRIRQLKLREQELERLVAERTRDLERTRAQLVHSEKMSSLGQLVAGIAHELNNPINFVYGNMDFLEEHAASLLAFVDAAEGLDLADEQRQKLAHRAKELELDFVREDLRRLVMGIRDGSERAAKIVQELRTFSYGGQSDATEVDLNAGITTTLSFAKAQAKDRVNITHELGPLPRVRCSPSQINQVVMNLVVNAIQAIEGKGNVTVRTRADSGSVIVEVEDDGCGMTPDVVAKMFDPFFTTKEVGKGMGLGLSISYGIVRAHDGTMEVESAPNKGTKVRVILPITGPKGASALNGNMHEGEERAHLSAIGGR